MVGTPIGNLMDISRRAIDILTSVDVIAAEDTRVSRKLLSNIGLKKRIISHHRYNEHGSSQGIIGLLKEGKSVALVSDSGTPCLSDPGAVLVSEARKAKINVLAIPGPSALTAALSVCGFYSKPMNFYGFLPSRGAARKMIIAQAAKQTGLQVFFEAPHRLQTTVKDLMAVFGTDRPVAVCKELTKLFERTIESTLGNFFELIEKAEFDMRGEFVIVIKGLALEPESGDAEVKKVLKVLLVELALKDAVRIAVQLTGKSRKLVYARALEIREK